MFCGNCGCSLNEGDAFCPSCGAAADAGLQAQRPLTAAPVLQGSQGTDGLQGASESAKRSGWKGVVIAAAACAGAVAVVVALVVGVMSLNQGGRSAEAPAPGADAGVQADAGGSFSDASGSSAEDTASSSGSVGADPSPSAPPFTSFSSVTASSTLPTDEVNYESYDASNVVDGDASSCWSEGSNGSGIGESLTFSAAHKQLFTGIVVWNGFQESDYLYEGNARVRTFEVYADGALVDTVTLPDSGLGSQRIDFAAPFEAKQVTLVIASVHAGDRHGDCCVSEIDFY